MAEKRNYPRFTTSIKVLELTTLKNGQTTNLSLGGCFITKSKEFNSLPLNSRLTLKFEIPGVNDIVVVFGVLKHYGEQEQGFGIQFQEVHKKSAYYLGRFIGNFL
jgi:hypothetical protein